MWWPKFWRSKLHNKFSSNSNSFYIWNGFLVTHMHKVLFITLSESFLWMLHTKQQQNSSYSNRSLVGVYTMHNEMQELTCPVLLWETTFWQLQIEKLLFGSLIKIYKCLFNSNNIYIFVVKDPPEERENTTYSFFELDWKHAIHPL